MQSSKNSLISFLMAISFVFAFLLTAFFMNDTLKSSHFAGAIAGGIALFLFDIKRKKTLSKK